ncbi:MAG: hypothetical protein ACKVP7_04190 [Hyphomicrobiaceae bacterium]
MRRRGTATPMIGGAPRDNPKGPQSRGDKSEAVLGEIVHALARAAARDSRVAPPDVDLYANPEDPPQQSTPYAKRKGSRKARIPIAPSKNAVAPDAALDAETAPPLTLRQIANTLNTSDDIARYLLRKRKIRGFKAGGQWRAYPDAVTEYVIEQLSRG